MRPIDGKTDKTMSKVKKKYIYQNGQYAKTAINYVKATI